jgi:hypothetical protein
LPRFDSEGTLVASIVMVFRGRRGSAGRLHLTETPRQTAGRFSFETNRKHDATFGRIGPLED